MDLAVYYELSKCFPSLLTWSAGVKRICIWKSLIALNQVFHANLSFWFFSNCLRTFVQERIPSTHRAWRGCSNHSWTEQKQKQERCFPCCWVSTGIFRNLPDPSLMRGRDFRMWMFGFFFLKNIFFNFLFWNSDKEEIIRSSKHKSIKLKSYDFTIKFELA